MVILKWTVTLMTFAQFLGWTAVGLELNALLHDLQWSLTVGSMDLENDHYGCGSQEFHSNESFFLAGFKKDEIFSNVFHSRSRSVLFGDEAIFLIILLTFLGMSIKLLFLFCNNQKHWAHSTVTKIIYILGGLGLLYASFLLWGSAIRMDQGYKVTATELRPLDEGLVHRSYNGNRSNKNCIRKHSRKLADIYLNCYNQSIFYHEDIPYFLAAQGYESYDPEFHGVKIRPQHWVEQLQSFVLSISKPFHDKDPSVVVHGKEYRFSNLTRLGFCQHEKQKIAASALTVICAMLCWLSLCHPCCLQDFDDEDEDMENTDTETVEAYIHPISSTQEPQPPGYSFRNQFSFTKKTLSYNENGVDNFLEIYSPHFPVAYNQFVSYYSSWSNLQRSLQSSHKVKVKKGIHKSYLMSDALGLY